MRSRSVGVCSIKPFWRLNAVRVKRRSSVSHAPPPSPPTSFRPGRPPTVTSIGRPPDARESGTFALPAPFTAELGPMAKSAATFAMLLLCLCRPAASDQLVKCTKPELSSCYCGKTTYDRQLLYAVNCTGTGLDAQKSMDVFMNLPNETEVSSIPFPDLSEWCFVKKKKCDL